MMRNNWVAELKTQVGLEVNNLIRYVKSTSLYYSVQTEVTLSSHFLNQIRNLFQSDVHSFIKNEEIFSKKTKRIFFKATATFHSKNH